MLISVLDELLVDDSIDKIMKKVLNECGIAGVGTERTSDRGEDYYIMARLRQFSANGLHKIHFLKICLAVSLITEHSDLFEMNVIFAAVHYHWNKFGRAIHLVFCIVYSVYIFLIFMLNILIHDHDHMSAGLLTAITIILFLSILFVAFEVTQIVSNLHDSADYVVGWIAYSLTLAGSILRRYYEGETQASAIVMAVATLFVFLKGLHFLRPFKLTGPTIRTVYAILFQILPLLAVLAVINIGFSQAFYLLSYTNPDLDSHGAGLSILFTYVYMTGQANWPDMFHTTTPSLALILMCVFIGLTTILIINLIIAKMNNVYSTVASNAMGEWKREQCKLIIKYSLFLNSFGTPDNNKRYLTILMREEFVEERKEQYLQRNCTNLMHKDVRDMKAKLNALEEFIKTRNGMAGQSMY